MTPDCIKVAPPTAYLNELTPYICIIVVNENTHKFAFSFAEFLKIWEKFAIYFNGNPALVSVLRSLSRDVPE